MADLPKLTKCAEHSQGKSCIKIIAEGNCLKEKCRLFPKVSRMIPKLENYYSLQAQGVFLTTIWDFSEDNMEKMEKQKKKAEKWLKEILPKIRQNL